MSDHVVLLTLVSFISSLEGRVFLLATYDEAKEFCQDSALVSVHNASENEHLRMEMASANPSSAWLPIKRTSHEKWIWTNHSRHEGFEGKTKHSCAVFDQNSGQIRPAPCSSTKYGHICEVKGCPNCNSLGWDSVTCQHLGDTCYVYFCDKVNWYGARLSCKQKGRRLAVASTQAIRRTLSQGKYACNVHWVGLRRGEWTYEEDGGRLQYENWGLDQPSDEGNCAYMQEDGTWKVSLCTAKHLAMCAGATSSDPTQSNYTIRWWIILLVVAICLGLIVLTIFLTYRFLKWRKEKNTSSGNRNNRENGVAGGVHTDNGPTDAKSLLTMEESPGTNDGTGGGGQPIKDRIAEWERKRT